MEAEAATSAAAEAADRKHRVKSDGDADDSDEVGLISWRFESFRLLFQGLKIRVLSSWCFSDMSFNLVASAFGL